MASVMYLLRSALGGVGGWLAERLMRFDFTEFIWTLSHMLGLG